MTTSEQAATPRNEWLQTLLARASTTRHQPGPAALVTVRDFWRGLPDQLRQPADASPFEQAVLGASYADRVAYATVCGHQAATRVIRPGIEPGALVAFCASEEGGAHPRAIRSLLTSTSEGFVLNGHKRWATLAPTADRLLVIASIGEESGRNLLRLLEVPADRAGITIRPMPATEFTPEIAHAEIEFAQVQIAQDEVVEGDAYLEAVKPFRLIEDTLIGCAVLALNLELALRHHWPEAACEELVALLLAGEALFRLQPSQTATHLAAAGWSRLRHKTVQRHLRDELWQAVPEDVRDSWQRDTGKSVAARARELRRLRAWQDFGRSAAEETPAKL